MILADVFSVVLDVLVVFVVVETKYEVIWLMGAKEASLCVCTRGTLPPYHSAQYQCGMNQQNTLEH